MAYERFMYYIREEYKVIRDRQEAIQQLNEEFNKGFGQPKELITDFIVDYQRDQFYAWVFVMGKERITWKYYFKTGNIEKLIEWSEKKMRPHRDY